MKNTAIIVLLLSLAQFIYGQGSIADSVFEEYKNLNDLETRLPDFKDNDSILKIKIIQLQIINESRGKRDLLPVKLDILASRVANKMCKEGSEEGFTGHWNTAGEKPYHRYAFAGGIDHVCENAYGEFSTSGEINIDFSFGGKEESDTIQEEPIKLDKKASPPFDNSNESILYFMNKGHQEFMKEKAPADGHKRNILNKWHNYVGIGYFMGEKNFRYYEEFIDRYYKFGEIPKTVKKKEDFTITVKTDEGWYLCYFIAFREKKLSKKNAFLLNFKGSYEDYSKERAIKIKPWELSEIRNGQTYTFNLKFKKRGLYYLHMYQDNKEYKKPNLPDITKKCQASGIVIRVE